jgi:hypothetical protein
MRALVLSLLFIGCVACEDDSNVTGPTTSALPISGRVIEFFSRETVGGVSLEFRNADGSPVIATATDAGGQYSGTLPRGGEYLVYAKGILRGSIYAGDVRFRGDLVIDDGRCVTRYGTVTDTAGRPVANAMVSLGELSAVSAGDGWYSLEFGCPAGGTIGGNTILMNVNRDGYPSWSRVVGRGITGIQRLDVALGRS